MTKLQPPAILLMGQSGSGKTFSLSTLIEAGIETFVISTEPRGIESLLDACAAKRLDLKKLHWKYIGPARPGFEMLIEQGELIARTNQEFLSKQNPKPRQDSPWIEVMKTLLDFKDDKDGKSYGHASKFGADKALVIDSLSGLSTMAMDLTIGDKVTAHPGEWGIAMRTLDKFLLSCCSDLNCYFVLLSHIEREDDPVNLGNKIMVSTLGKKLAPQIPKFFSEVISAESDTTDKDIRTFRWSTNTANYVLKNRSLPVSSKLQPSFGPIVEAYKKRVAQIS